MPITLTILMMPWLSFLATFLAFLRHAVLYSDLGCTEDAVP